MSLKLLGEDFDIHGGAQDLIFPHHENEIAQSEGATGSRFVRYWIHGGLLNIDKEKMSKSLGNVMLLGDLLKQWSANSVRMFMLSTHYRNPLDFTKEGLVQARANVERLERTIQHIDFALGLNLPVSSAKTDRLAKAVDQAHGLFTAAMDDDFNSAEALSAIFGLIKETNTVIEGAEDLPDRVSLESSRAALVELTEALGLSHTAGADWRKVEPELRQIAKRIARETPVDAGRETILTALLEKRTEARKAKNWETADDIRNSLLEIGIEIEDTPAGPRWKLTKA